MGSMFYVNEIYKITHHWEWCTPYEVVSCYDNPKDGL